MKFADVLTSSMNGVQVRRKLWPTGQSLETELYLRTDSDPVGEHYTFTVDDEKADDWQIVVPRPVRGATTECG